MCGVASGFEFGALLGKRGCIGAWVDNDIGGIRSREEEEESKVSDWRFVALVLMEGEPET